MAANITCGRIYGKVKIEIVIPDIMVNAVASPDDLRDIAHALKHVARMLDRGLQPRTIAPLRFKKQA